MASLEGRITDLERRVQLLSKDIDVQLAKDKELLARIRGGQGYSRAMRHEDDFSLPSTGGHPYDEPALDNASSNGYSSTSTDNAVVLTEKPTSAQNKLKKTVYRESNSV